MVRAAIRADILKAVAAEGMSLYSREKDLTREQLVFAVSCAEGAGRPVMRELIARLVRTEQHF